MTIKRVQFRAMENQCLRSSCVPFACRASGVSTDGPKGKMVLTVLGMVAEIELGFIKDRQRTGIEKAKAEGVYKGRPVTLDHAKLLQMHKEGSGPTKIAKAMKCSRSAVYEVLRAA